MKMFLETKPISVNGAYVSNFSTGRRFLSKEGKRYKEELAWCAKHAFPSPMEGKLEARYTFGFQDNRRRDVDDYIKLTQDALSGLAFLDDSQIQYLTAKKVIGQGYFVEIEVLQYYATSSLEGVNL